LADYSDCCSADSTVAVSRLRLDSTGKPCSAVVAGAVAAGDIEPVDGPEVGFAAVGIGIAAAAAAAVAAAVVGGAAATAAASRLPAQIAAVQCGAGVVAATRVNSASSADQRAADRCAVEDRGRVLGVAGRQNRRGDHG